jgi:hypothetical protein
MLPALLAAQLLTNLPVDPSAGESPLTSLRFTTAPEGLLLGWSDTEDVLRGTVEPARPRAQTPLTVTLRLEALQGRSYDGPLTVSLRPLSTIGGAQSVTVPPTPGERLWRVTFTPAETGDHRLEVSWRGSHFKAVRGTVTVGEAGLPSWFPVAAGLGLILVASCGGAWFLLGRQEKSP